jgi:selenide,water dikinase
MASQLPVIGPGVWDLLAQECVPGGTRHNLKCAEEYTTWVGATDAQKLLLADAQTSGGLLLCVPPKRLEVVRAVLRNHRAPCATVIGCLVRDRQARILVSA